MMEKLPHKETKMPHDAIKNLYEGMNIPQEVLNTIIVEDSASQGTKSTCNLPHEVINIPPEVMHHEVMSRKGAF